ncbi:PREDICTED: probable disease resistance [Prunus dulcis]|uniref:PREDICTED: probable disease resistance n=1 Tax=Prunus dulcis TaxID=3755 RepID=A0A5E4EX06_PRUDU|nr:PREDICTED: probable disease resistance [Prunus dulcis]
MAEIILGVIGPVMQLGQWLWSPAKRGLGYMVHYKRNTESLNLQIEELKVKKHGNQNLVDAFQLNGEEPEIKKWFEDANKAIADAAQLTGEVAASKNCISGMCPDLRWRYNLGKKAMEEKEAVNKLLKKGDFQTISVQVPHPIEIESTMSTGGFQAYGSTSRAMNQVMTALKDDKVTVIGVYGMGGVGKTTMVKQVGAQARKDGLFDHVIMAVFSQNPDLMKIQGQLSDMLGLKLQEETELGRAGRLKERILRRSKTLIILDDIWNASQTLTSIGIPNAIELQGCNSKVLLTTRRLNVCHVMKSHVKVRLDVLSVEDSWNLFTKEAGRSFDSRTSYDVAREVSGECAGLPIALIAVARALGDKDFDEWKEAARRLEMSQPANLEDDGDVFKCIKLSYEYLKGEDAKSCFLLCSLFAEDSDIAIQDLFSYGFGYGLFRDGNTLEGARAKARSVTKYLKASSLLLDGKSEEYVRMHDVIRDMAILIASSEEHGHRFLVKAGWELNVWPNDTDEGCSAISLMGNCIRKLPDELVCPKLQILLLNDNRTIEEIPEAFFQSLNALRVLDLTPTSISILPSSFNFLINLQTLHLDGCRYLKDISVLGKLKKLEILSLRSSGFKKFPEEIGNLANLRLLDLSWNSNMNIIPSKVISRLSRLEELLMEGSFGDWGGKVEGAGERINAGFDELTCLSYLNILSVRICNVECIPKDVGFLPNWEKFFICIKRESVPMANFTHSDSDCPRVLVLDTTIDTLPSWFKSVVIERTEKIFYSECRGLNNFLVEYATERLHGLISLSVEQCNHMPSLMNTTTTLVPNRPVLEKLEELYVYGLNDLKELCVGDLPHGSLGNLKILQVTGCEALEGTLLQPNLWQKLQNLEVLDIQSMSRMEYVFESEGLKQEHVAFRNWREMTLVYLRELKSIWNGPAQYAIFHNLKVLTVYGCGKLKTIFTTDGSHCLMQLELEELNVSNCYSLETIIGANEGTLEDKIIFPRLRCILLRSLPELKSFYSGGSGGVECPSLEYLYVHKCHSQFSVSASDFHSQKQVQVDTGPIPVKRYVFSSLISTQSKQGFCVK